MKAPFRYDIVGSFLRPDYLKQAREKYFCKEIDEKELKKIEDQAILELVNKQKEVGLKAVTDGELRRRYWHLDFLASLIGVEEVKAKHWSVDFKGHQPKAANVKIVGKIDFDYQHPFLEHYEYLQSIAGDTLCKMTIPSPTMLHLMACVREKDYTPIDMYQDEDRLLKDIAGAYQKAVKAFYQRGCRYLQLDDTSWGEFCDISKRNTYINRGLDIDIIQEKYVQLINDVLSVKPDDMVITMHICRGNFRSTWFSSGGYGPVAKTLFFKCQVDGFFLEYDSERSGDFKPLKYVQKQKVVLGLVTSKFPELEDKEMIKERIQEASQYVPLEQLCLSPQCGFSSTEEGNVLTDDDQWKKIELIKEIAKDVWG